MIHTLIADGQGAVREGLALLLRAAPDIDVVAVARNSVDAITLVAEHRPDVLLIAADLTEGAAITRQVATGYPATRVLVLTSVPESTNLAVELAAGATGFALKEEEGRQLIARVRSAAEGKLPLYQAAARDLPASAESPPPDVHLTAREHEVLALIAEGMSNKLIAQTLAISEKTVKTHVSHILERIGVHDRTQAALWARDHRAEHPRGVFSRRTSPELGAQ